MASSAARAFLAYPIPNHFLKSCRQQFHPHHLFVGPWLPAISVSKRKGFSSAAVVSCLIPGVDGGGVSDDFVSTRKSGFSREFAVIANMLKRIEPLDTSVISKGVPDSAKDSMKQTISSMLGLLPSDQFSVSVSFSKGPLYHLVISSIITGYTLWNAEYRISLIRNFDLPLDITRRSDNGLSEMTNEEREIEGDESRPNSCIEDVERLAPGDLSPEVLNYIQQLESELSMVKQELHDQKQENLQMEYAKDSNNDLLEYLRSLEPDMVAELAKPSTPEVEEVIHQLADKIVLGIVGEDASSDFIPESYPGKPKYPSHVEDYCDTIGTSRDYLAKLLFCFMDVLDLLSGIAAKLQIENKLVSITCR